MLHQRKRGDAAASHIIRYDPGGATGLVVVVGGGRGCGAANPGGGSERTTRAAGLLSWMQKDHRRAVVLSGGGWCGCGMREAARLSWERRGVSSVILNGGGCRLVVGVGAALILKPCGRGYADHQGSTTPRAHGHPGGVGGWFCCLIISDKIRNGKPQHGGQPF